MNFSEALTSRLPASLMAVATLFLLPTAVRAADHGDAPALAQDQGADIADLYLFMDPNNAAQSTDDVILIGTFHGFITPGEAVNFAVFDPNIKYRFNIYNDHVNLPPPIFGSTGTKAQQAAALAKVKPNRTIDVTFSRRMAADDSTGPAGFENHLLPEYVRRASPQTATVTLSGFPAAVKTKVFTGLPTTPPNIGTTGATPQVTKALDTKDGMIQFFAGEVDDPFFFDIPGFAGLIESFRQHALPPNPSVSVTSLNRGRDTFAGYNVLAIALKVPKALLLGTNGNIIGADFNTQRQTTKLTTDNGPKGVGVFKTVDRIANPGINVALIGVNHKDAYNSSTPKLDATLKFALSDIIPILTALGVNTNLSGTLDPYFAALANIAVTRGDVLQLDTSVANSGPSGGDVTGTGFGTLNGGGQPIGGRRLRDDVIDTILTVINHGTTLGDNAGPDSDVVNGVTFRPHDIFPFLHEPHQPLARSSSDPAQADTNVDDGTRN